MMKTGCLTLDLEKTKDLSSVLSLKKILQVEILGLLTQVSDGLTDSWVYSDIPLLPTVAERDLTYRSAIALKLGKQTRWEQEILAERVFNALMNRTFSQDITNPIELEVQLIDRVWLTFILDCSSLQVWLRALFHQFNSRDDLNKRPKTTGITENAIAGYCQYAHARASALLRLAEQAKILPLLPSTESVSIVELSSPMRSLLEQILRVIDQPSGKAALLNQGMNYYHNNFYRPLNPPILGDFHPLVPPKLGGLGGQNIHKISNAEKTPEHWLKVSKNLSQALLFFEQHHRLFNPKNQSHNELAWLLLINTRAILATLLLTKLQIPAPDEL
jgi:hypothetical protein